jgi:hypothetical protein
MAPENIYTRFPILLSLCMIGLLTGCATGTMQQTESADGHAHQHMEHDVQRDALGRQLYGMAHEMSPEVLAELRERNVFPPYMTDEQIGHAMRSMGSNYVWYVSDTALEGNRGVLVLAHGFGAQGDEALRASMEPVGQAQPAAMALGMSMAMSSHIQLALDDLTNAGAQEIAVIPVVSSPYSTLMRQWEYIFGLRDDPEYATVPKVSTSAKLGFASPMEDHPFVKVILSDYAAEISKDPAKEELIIVAHGPVDATDNKAQLETMGRMAESLREEGYAGVYAVTLQDDAPREVRAANVAHMRTLVEEINARGHAPLVITNLIGTRMVQASIKRDLSGLGYRYNFRGLVQHEKFIDWVQVAADDAFVD